MLTGPLHLVARHGVSAFALNRGPAPADEVEVLIPEEARRGR